MYFECLRPKQAQLIAMHFQTKVLQLKGWLSETHLAKTGTTQCHAQLGLSGKSHAIKGLVV